MAPFNLNAIRGSVLKDHSIRPISIETIIVMGVCAIAGSFSADGGPPAGP